MVVQIRDKSADDLDRAVHISNEWLTAFAIHPG